MKKILALILVTFSLIFTGCPDRQDPPTQVNLDKVIDDLVAYSNSKKETRSATTLTIMEGIYVSDNYYSIAKLGTMVFNERVALLEAIEANANTYVVVENKLKLFSAYISVADILANGAVATTKIDKFLLVNNIETSKKVYANGTTLTKINITTLPKVLYNYGEAFSFTGIAVTGTNIDGTTVALTPVVTDFSIFNSSVIGTQVITVTIFDRVATYTVTVQDVISKATFTFIRNIDILKLFQYSAHFEVNSSNVSYLILAANGGITPGKAIVTNKVADLVKITMDNTVTTITVKAYDVNNNLLGNSFIVTLK